MNRAEDLFQRITADLAELAALANQPARIQALEQRVEFLERLSRAVRATAKLKKGRAAR